MSMSGCSSRKRQSSDSLGHSAQESLRCSLACHSITLRSALRRLTGGSAGVALGAAARAAPPAWARMAPSCDASSCCSGAAAAFFALLAYWPVLWGARRAFWPVRRRVAVSKAGSAAPQISTSTPAPSAAGPHQGAVPPESFAASCACSSIGWASSDSLTSTSPPRLTHSSTVAREPSATARVISGSDVCRDSWRDAELLPQPCARRAGPPAVHSSARATRAGSIAVRGKGICDRGGARPADNTATTRESLKSEDLRI